MPFLQLNYHHHRKVNLKPYFHEILYFSEENKTVTDIKTICQRTKRHIHEVNETPYQISTKRFVFSFDVTKSSFFSSSWQFSWYLYPEFCPRRTNITGKRVLLLEKKVIERKMIPLNIKNKIYPLPRLNIKIFWIFYSMWTDAWVSFHTDTFSISFTLEPFNDTRAWSLTYFNTMTTTHITNYNRWPFLKSECFLFCFRF